jgi:hypothetical protein
MSTVVRHAADPRCARFFLGVSLSFTKLGPESSAIHRGMILAIVKRVGRCIAAESGPSPQAIPISHQSLMQSVNQRIPFQYPVRDRGGIRAAHAERTRKERATCQPLSLRSQVAVVPS